MSDEHIEVTQADRDAAEEWGFIECRHCSEYEGDFVPDLALAFARHRSLTPYARLNQERDAT